MKKYHYIKKWSKVGGRGSLYDIFELDTFSRSLTLSIEHITAVNDHYKYAHTANQVELTSFLASSSVMV